MEEQKNWWKCSACGYTQQSAVPPEACPSCHRTCTFVDVTCYTPECGGSSGPDPNIMR